jgi:hypothetical protein
MHIAITLGADGFTGNSTTEELAAIDLDASMHAFADQLTAKIRVDYPDAHITLSYESNSPSKHVQVSLTEDEAAAGELEWSVEALVEDREATIWDNGDFWVERTI